MRVITPASREKIDAARQRCENRIRVARAAIDPRLTVRPNLSKAMQSLAAALEDLEEINREITPE